MDDAEDERNDHVRQDSDTLENETLSGFEESTAAGCVPRALSRFGPCIVVRFGCCRLQAAIVQSLVYLE